MNRAGGARTPPGPKARLLERGFQVVFILADSPEGARLARLADLARLSRATTLRILRTLQQLDVVEFDEAARLYRLGAAVRRLGTAALEHGDLARLAQPVLEQLQGMTGETACLFRRRGDERVCIASVESRQDLRFAMAVGQRRPLLRGAPGLLLVAYLPSDTQRSLLDGVPSARRRAVSQACRRLRARGVAISHDEVVVGGTAIATPVFGPDGRVMAALALLGPSARMDPDAARRLVPLLARSARVLSRKVAGRRAPAGVRPPGSS